MWVHIGYVLFGSLLLGAIVSFGAALSIIRKYKLRNEIGQRGSKEADLTFSGDYCRDIFNTAVQFMWVLSPEGIVLDANDIALRASGMVRQAVLGSPFWQGYWWQNSPENKAQLRRAIASAAQGEFIRYDVEILGLNHALVPIDFSLRPITDELGQVVLLIPEGRDLTEQKQTDSNEGWNAKHVRLELNILEQILEIVLAGYWDWDIPNHQEYLSPRFKRMFGYEDHELPNTPDSWQDLIFSDDLPRVLDCFNRHVQSRGDVPYYNEVRYRHKDGSTVWVICSGQVIEWDIDGNPLRMIGCHIDITERKKAEAELESSRAYYQSIIADQTELICRFLPDSTLTFVNDAYCNFFQKSPEELLGQSFTFLLPDDDKDIPLQQFSSLSRDKPVETCEHRVIAPDGSISWQQWTNRALFDSGGNFIEEFQAVGRDVTALKEAEGALRQSEARWEFALEGAGDGVWDWMIQSNTVFYSQQWKAMLGYADHEVGNRIEEWDSRIHPDDKAQCYVDLNAHLNKETPICQSEYRIRCKDGSYKWILDRGKVLEWMADGKPLRMIGTHTDISGRKCIEEKIQQYAAQLEASNRELEAFTYSVSHDLRAPLRHVGGFINALRLRLEATSALHDSKIAHYMDVVENSSQKMGALIEGLLTLSRVGRRDMTVRSVNLRALVQQIVDDMRSTLPGNSALNQHERELELAYLSTDLEMILHDLPIVEGDEILLKQAFYNLIDNAVKFSRDRRPPRIEIGLLAHQPGSTTQTLYIKDNGVGFQMEYADQLFGAFQRLHSQSEFSGTGIGLAIVQRIIHRHGGAIWAESCPGNGACFYIRLQMLSEV